MAKFIEVEPIENGERMPKVLINIDKIDYVIEDINGLAVIYLNDFPLPTFFNRINVAVPFTSLSNEIQKAKEVEE